MECDSVCTTAELCPHARAAACAAGFASSSRAAAWHSFRMIFLTTGNFTLPARYSRAAFSACLGRSSFGQCFSNIGRTCASAYPIHQLQIVALLCVSIKRISATVDGAFTSPSILRSFFAINNLQLLRYQCCRYSKGF